MQLESLGFDVDITKDGKVAFDMVQAWEENSLVLMDCQMPRMNGYEATQKFRSAEVLDQRIPIVALTANALKGEREACIDSGMDDYLTKPLKKHELLHDIGRFIETPVVTQSIEEEIDEIDSVAKSLRARMEEMKSEVGDKGGPFRVRNQL